MTEKEDYEFAAKAAGIEIECNDNGVFGYYSLFRGHLPQWEEWNPKDDDGDSFRLMVKLGLLVHGDASPCSVYCQVGECPDAFLEKSKPDPYAATRRAIFRAAVEIGKAMQ